MENQYWSNIFCQCKANANNANGKPILVQYFLPRFYQCQVANGKPILIQYRCQCNANANNCQWETNIDPILLPKKIPMPRLPMAFQYWANVCMLSGMSHISKRAKHLRIKTCYTCMRTWRFKILYLYQKLISTYASCFLFAISPPLSIP